MKGVRVPGQDLEGGELLSADHTILERPCLQFRPFGEDEQGDKISDVSGLLIRDNVEYLEDCVRRVQGPGAGEGIVEHLCALLNERIRDPAYHVTPAFLKNVWNSYSYEFACFVREFCKVLSGDPQYHYNVGKEKHISPLIQTLGRPFALSQIHKMYPYFAHKYARALECTVMHVTDNSAVLRLQFPERVLQQFGPYRKACAAQTCESSKSRIAMVPVRVHGRTASIVKDRACIVKGDAFCEWEVTWTPERRALAYWPLWGLLSGAAVFASAMAADSPPSLWTASVAGLIAGGTALLGTYLLQREAKAREAVIQEQVGFVDTRHEELRESYLEQQRIAVELRRKVGQLTSLHRAGLLLSSTLNRETLLRSVAKTIVEDLQYDRVMVTWYDPLRCVAYGARLFGVPEPVAAFAATLEIPVSDPASVEGTVLLEGRPILINDVQEVRGRMHPLYQELVSRTGCQSFVSVPLKAKDWILGSLTVDRRAAGSLTQEDVDVLVTLASQLSIALDNAAAYREIEELNMGLEEKVRQRTAELEAANEKLRDLNQLKSTFVSVVSHELRTPLTSIRSFIENMLDGMTGALNEKQSRYLSRMLFNIDRLSRLIVDLLDLSRIEAGKVELRLQPVAVADGEKSVTLEARHDQALPSVRADSDHLTQILTNLIGNAIKFTPVGGRVEVHTGTQEPGLVRISVSDTGCGIAPEDLPKVFEKFYRGVSVPPDARGAGLGLAIAKSLVELHGGRIWVESVQWGGSSFSFTIPAHPPGETAG
jgi:signal transduction histidine kinase